MRIPDRVKPPWLQRLYPDRGEDVMTVTRLALVVLASEQLWPNIHSLVHWAENDPLQPLSDVCIYHTDNKHRSYKPALRFQQLCRSLYPGIQVHFPDPENKHPEQPDAVYRQIMAWQKQLPGRHWILNATGGLKLMFAGVLDCVGENDVSIVYREFSGKWYQLFREHQILAKELLIEEKTNHIPVLELVKAQLTEDHTILEAEPPPNITSLQLAEIIRCGYSLDWNWKDIFERVGIAARQQQGPLFEQFVAAVLQAIGVHNLVLNLKLTAVRQNLHEIDVVANYGGRLLIVDCKLLDQLDEEQGTVEGITSQIRQAATTQRHLGGREAKLLLLRPNRELSEHERDLAKAYQIEVVDRNDGWKLCSHLAKFVGIETLPPELQQAEEDLQKQKDQGIFHAYSREPGWIKQMAPKHKTRAIFEQDTLLNSLLDRYMKAQQQDWIAYRDSGKIFFRWQNSQSLSKSAFQSQADELKPFGSVKGVQLSKQGNTLYCYLLPHPEKEDELKSFLEARICKNFRL